MKHQTTIEWYDQADSLAFALEHSGLDYMTALKDGKLPPPPIAVTMNIEVADVGDGFAIFIGNPEPQHFNPLGTVHGGYAATILDSALGCAVHTIVPKGMTYGTTQLNVNYTRPIMPHVAPLTCTGTVLHRGRTTATAEAKLEGKDGKLYAHATTTCSIFPIPTRG